MKGEEVMPNYREDTTGMPPRASDAGPEDPPISDEDELRWLDSTEGYPKCMLSLITVSAARAALDWIDANCPQAWYRPMFADLWPDRKTVSTTKPPKPDAAT